VAKTSVALVHLAHGRSGDKGNTANIGLIAYRSSYYPLLCSQVTPERVSAHLAPLGIGAVERFELAGLKALNFLVHGALGGGGTLSLRTDSQGKVLVNALLRMMVVVPESIAAECRVLGRVPGVAAVATTPLEKQPNGDQ